MLCFRCGVEFDGSDYLPDAPCEDCQLDVGGEWRKIDVVAAFEYARRRELVKRYHARLWSDKRIGEATGQNSTVVYRLRKELGLKANSTGGTDGWTEDTVEVIRAASQAYWDDPNRKPRGGGHGPAVAGRLSDPEDVREDKRAAFDAMVTGKSQTYKGHKSTTFVDQRRTDG